MSPKIIILIAIVCLIVAVVFGAQSYMFLSKSEKTSARVMRLDNPKGKMVTPVFEYSVKGKHYEYKGASTSPGNYELNDKEIIYYDPAHPEDSKLGTFMNLWFVPVFCSGFFIILLLVGIVSAFPKKTYAIKSL